MDPGFLHQMLLKPHVCTSEMCDKSSDLYSLFGLFIPFVTLYFSPFFPLRSVLKMSSTQANARMKNRGRPCRARQHHRGAGLHEPETRGHRRDRGTNLPFCQPVTELEDSLSTRHVMKPDQTKMVSSPGFPQKQSGGKGVFHTAEAGSRNVGKGSPPSTAEEGAERVGTGRAFLSRS